MIHACLHLGRTRRSSKYIGHAPASLSHLSVSLFPSTSIPDFMFSNSQRTGENDTIMKKFEIYIKFLPSSGNSYSSVSRELESSHPSTYYYCRLISLSCSSLHLSVSSQTQATTCFSSYGPSLHHPSSGSLHLILSSAHPSITLFVTFKKKAVFLVFVVIHSCHGTRINSQLEHRPILL